MKSTLGIAALAAVLAIVCAAVAWEWYTHVAGDRAAPRAVQQLAAASPPPTAAPSPSAGPVTYVPLPSASHAPVSPVPSPSAAPSAQPSPAAPGATTPAPTPYEATPSRPVPSQPMVPATIAPHVTAVKPIAEPPDAPPRILAMSISTPVAKGGDVVSGTVETSTNVASVEARIAGYSSTMQKIGAGRFALAYRVPYLPFFLHRTYQIEVIARNTKGDAVRSSVPITIR